MLAIDHKIQIKFDFVYHGSDGSRVMHLAGYHVMAHHYCCYFFFKMTIFTVSRSPNLIIKKHCLISLFKQIVAKSK